MKIVIAPDSFKESLDALAVAQAIETGFKRVLPQAQYDLIPMADGGEGTVQSLVDATHGRIERMSVTGPLGECVRAFFGVSGDGGGEKTAFIEMSAASGLHLVPMAQRNPLTTTSYGTGELIKAALDLGVKRIILGLGGSATNDAGAGMLQALGVRFLDERVQMITWGGAALASVAQVDLSQLDARLAKVSIQVACDVDNPLCGERGASAVFAPQKGATPQQVMQLDHTLAHFAAVVRSQLGLDIASHAGAGAAGGMGGGLMLLPHVQLQSWVQIVAEAVRLSERVRDADLVITGEGRMDGQRVHGKTPIGVARVAKQFDKPVIALVGSLGEGYEAVYAHGIDAVFPIIRQVGDLSVVLPQAEANLISCSENVARLLNLR